MKTSRRAFLARLMREAWALARMGASRFGGSAVLYFSIALRLVWRDSRPRAVLHTGIGNRFLLPGMPLPEGKQKAGQFLLPGIAK